MRKPSRLTSCAACCELSQHILVGVSGERLDVAISHARACVADFSEPWVSVIDLWSEPADPFIAADQTSELQNLVRRDAHTECEHVPATIALALCLAESLEILGVVQ